MRDEQTHKQECWKLVQKSKSALTFEQDSPNIRSMNFVQSQVSWGDGHTGKNGSAGEFVSCNEL